MAEFEKRDFPLDVIGLEPGWQSFAYPCSFDWDETRFPEPKRLLDRLSQKGIKVNLWENPYVAPTSTISQALKPYTASHTVWLGEVPDYTIEAARKVLLDHASFPSGHSAVQIRQLYGLVIQDMFMQRFREMNKRTYGLVRSSNGAASPSGFVIYSDYYDHRGYVTALVNCSLAGVLWTPEIRSARSGEEWLRRFQSVCFSPLVQLNAWSSGKKPWSFPRVTDLVRDVIKLRARLLPYMYTAFYDYNQRGIPPFRAMVLEAGFDLTEEIIAGKVHGEDNPYAETMRLETTDQYMMGPSRSKQYSKRFPCS